MQNVSTLHGVELNGKADIHFTADPVAAPGTILDTKGDVITPRRGLMEKLDAKASRKIEISQGTAWLLGAIVVIANLLFNYGGSILSSARDDQSQKEQITALQSNLASKAQKDEQAAADMKKEMEKLNDKIDSMQQNFQQQALKDAEQRGFKLGVTSAEPTGNK